MRKLKMNLQINVTKADTGELITRFQHFEQTKVVYERLEVYANINALTRGVKKVFGVLEVITKRDTNVEEEIARIRSQLKGLEDMNKEKEANSEDN